MPDELRYADRSDRGKLLFTGDQAGWFLHQILTRSIEDMVDGEAREGALLTVHGRMVGYLEIVRRDDEYLASFEPELRATLPQAISGYVFATRVEIVDVSDAMGLVLVLGEGALDAARAVRPAAVMHRTDSLGVEAAYVWCERDRLADVASALQEAGAKPVEENELEAIRIANGVPRWGKDMNQKTIAPEAGIDGRAIDYEKGCYPGQEAVAKIHFRGHVNRKLRRLTAAGSIPVDADVMVDGQKVGTITSSAGNRALAMLRHTIEPGTSVSVDGLEAEVVA